MKALYEYIVHKTPIKGVDTGILRVDEKNIDLYYRTQEWRADRLISIPDRSPRGTVRVSGGPELRLTA